MSGTRITADQLDEALTTLHPDWSGSVATLTRSVTFPAFLTAVEFISQLAPIAEELDHHPDLSLSWRTVDLTLSTHSAGGVTDLDVTLARRLDPIIAALAG